MEADAAVVHAATVSLVCTSRASTALRLGNSRSSGWSPACCGGCKIERNTNKIRFSYIVNPHGAIAQLLAMHLIGAERV